MSSRWKKNPVNLEEMINNDDIKAIKQTPNIEYLMSTQSSKESLNFFLLACYQARYEVVKLFDSLNVYIHESVDIRGNFCFHLCCCQNNQDSCNIIDYFVEKYGPDVLNKRNTSGLDVFSFCCVNNLPFVVCHLLEHYKNSIKIESRENAFNKRPINLCLCTDSFDCFSHLVDFGSELSDSPVFPNNKVNQYKNYYKTHLNSRSNILVSSKPSKTNTITHQIKDEEDTKVVPDSNSRLEEENKNLKKLIKKLERELKKYQNQSLSNSSFDSDNPEKLKYQKKINIALKRENKKLSQEISELKKSANEQKGNKHPTQQELDFRRQISDMQNKINQLNNTINEQNTIIEHLQNNQDSKLQQIVENIKNQHSEELSSKEVKIVEQQDEIESMKTIFRQYYREKRSLEKKIANIESELSKKTNDNTNNVMNENARLKVEIRQTQNENAFYIQQISNLQNQISDLNDRIHEQNNTIEQSQQVNEHYAKRVSILQQEIENLKNQHLEELSLKEVTIVELRDERDNMIEHKLLSHKNKKLLEKKIADLESELAKKTNDTLNNVMNENDRLKAEIRKLKSNTQADSSVIEENKKLRRDVQAYQRKYQKAINNLAELKQIVTEAFKRLDELKEQNKKLNKELKELKNKQPKVTSKTSNQNYGSLNSPRRYTNLDSWFQ